MSKRRNSGGSEERNKYRISPKTEGQRDYVDALNDPQIRYLAISGPSGSGKTILAAQRAAEGLSSGEFKRILLGRSVTAIETEDIGFLPGSKSDKLQPWLEPITDHLEKFLPDLNYLSEAGLVDSLSLGLNRGKSWDKSFIIITEAQNLTYDTLKCILTRPDFRSKLILDGDNAQNDRKSKITAFSEICRALEPLETFEHIELGPEDIVRSREIVKILEYLKPLDEKYNSKY